MNNNFKCLDLNSLKKMHELKLEELNHSLIQGVSWDQLREQRTTVTEISIALQEKRNGQHVSLPHPAEKNIRKESGDQ